MVQDQHNTVRVQETQYYVLCAATAVIIQYDTVQMAYVSEHLKHFAAVFLYP
jgi:hypothetical protein